METPRGYGDWIEPTDGRQRVIACLLAGVPAF
jgi:hypothetical protein